MEATNWRRSATRVIGDGLGIAKLPEWTDWRRALIATGVLQQRSDTIKIWTLDGIQQRA